MDNKYILDQNNVDNTHACNISADSLPCTCNLDPQNLNQIQQQDENITKLIAKCKSSKTMKPPTIWMNIVLYIKKSETDLIFFMLLWFPKPCLPIFYMNATMHWDIMVPKDYTISLEEITIGKICVKIVINMCLPAQNVNR